MCLGIGGIIGGVVGGVLNTKAYENEKKELRNIINGNKNKYLIEKILIEISNTAGSGYGSKYEGIYVLNDPTLRSYFLTKSTKKNQLDYLLIEKFDPEGLKRVEGTKEYKNAELNFINDAKEKYRLITDITKTDLEGRLIKFSSKVFKLAGS